MVIYAISGKRLTNLFQRGKAMLFTKRTYLPVLVFLLASMACSVPAIFTPDASAVNTAVAETVNAGFTQNVPQATMSPSLEAASTATATFTLEPPTASQTPTAAPTATPVFMPSSPVSLISVSVDTNCRSGPGKIYDMEGALLVGEFAEVYGRDPTNNYWYIRNPDADPIFCWIWGKYATLIGPFLLLPVFTPPPTPTATITPLPSPAFNAEYASLDTCNGSWWVEIKLKNTGSVPLKSVEISVKDKATDLMLVNLSDGFTNLDGCLGKTTKAILKAGDTYLLSAPAFIYNPTGHKLVVTITLCSDTGQKGMCATNKIDFTP